MYQDELLNSIVNPNWRNDELEEVRKKAFNDGFQLGLDANQKAVNSFFKSNFKSATTKVEKVFSKFDNIDVKCDKVFLRVNAIDSFEFLFVVDEKSFLSDAKKAIYKMLREVKSSLKKDIKMEFLVMPNGNQINTDLMKSEGFRFKYEPRTRKA